MKKKGVILAIVGLAILVAILAAAKALQIRAMVKQGEKAVPPPETVTTAMVRAESWESALTAVGTLIAVQGVNLAAELPGRVVRIAFEAGTEVKKGNLLLSQDISSEKAQLPGAVAQAELTLSELLRAGKMLEGRMISQASYDSGVASRKQALPQEGNIRATIAKKTIRAPFSGRLGIRQVNLGQMLREGDPIVTLQSIHPIYVNFSLPQQQLARLSRGLPVRVTCDALPGVTTEGTITAINPLVDSATRNIQVQATVANRGGELLPGMFVTASVGLPVREKVLAIPSTAVLYAPYGDSVFIVEDDAKRKGGKLLHQQFVRLGEKRGDFIAVTSGLKEGQIVVSTGVFKLTNGQAVVVDNRLAPTFRQAPTPEND